MMKIERIKETVVSIVSIDKMQEGEWFGKEMFRIVLLTENGEEISRIFSDKEYEQLVINKYYYKLVSKDIKY